MLLNTLLDIGVPFVFPQQVVVILVLVYTYYSEFGSRDTGGCSNQRALSA